MKSLLGRKSLFLVACSILGLYVALASISTREISESTATLEIEAYIEEDGEWVLTTGPVCVGEKVKFVATHSCTEMDVTLTVTGGAPDPATITGQGSVSVPVTGDRAGASQLVAVANSGDGDSQEMTITVVGLDSIDVWDSNGRHDRRGLLEVVPPRGGEDINGKAATDPAGSIPPTGQPVWSYAGVQKTGLQVTFAKGAAGYTVDEKLLKNLTGRGSEIVCFLGSDMESAVITRYPHNIGVVNVSTAPYAAFVTSLVNEVLAWVSGVEVKAFEVNFDFLNRWQEMDGRHEAIWTYDTTLSADPLISAQGEVITIKPKRVKKFIKKVKKNRLFQLLFEDLDIELAVTLNGKVVATIHFEKKADGTYHAEVLRGNYSEIGIGGTAGIVLIPRGDFFSFVATGGLSDTMFYTIGAYATESEIGVKTGIGHKGLLLTVVIEVTVPWSEDPIKIVSRGTDNPIVLVKADEIKPKKCALYEF